MWDFSNEILVDDLNNFVKIFVWYEGIYVLVKDGWFR